jgi:hypothetical protein
MECIMAKEADPSATSATPPSPEFINQIAETVANLVAARTGAVGVPVVEVISSNGNVVNLGALNGSFTIKILIGTTAYSLVASIPGTGTYNFTLTEKRAAGPDVTLASFIFKDPENWKVEVGLPQITIGSVTLEECKISLGMGSVS